MVTPVLSDQWLTVYGGEAREVLRALPERSVHTVMTSPPFYGLRSYGLDDTVWGAHALCEHEWGPALNLRRGNGGQRTYGSFDGETGRGEAVETFGGQLCTKCDAWLGQLGLEPTPQEFVAHIVEVMAEVWRVLRDDGTLWLNLGDSWNSNPSWGRGQSTLGGRPQNEVPNSYHSKKRLTGFKEKELLGIPWRTAIALSDWGWNLRSEVVWHKPNALPESVTDRPSKGHEQIFLFSKRARYFYDGWAVREPATYVNHQRRTVFDNTPPTPPGTAPHGGLRSISPKETGRNLRDVWAIPTQPYKGAHYAVWPRALVEPMVKASTSEKGVCPDCGEQWVRRLGRDCEQCGEFILRQRKACENCGYVRNWKEGREVSEDMLATDWSTHGKGTPRLPGGFENALRQDGWELPCGHHDAKCDEDPIGGHTTEVPAVILDPFAGSGTTGVVAQSLSRRAILIDQNADYLAQQLERNAQTPLGLTL